MIRPLKEEELTNAAALAAAAFRDDAGFSYLVPDDAERRWRLPSMIEATLRSDAIRGGAVAGAFDDGALVGVSSVLPPSAAEPDLAVWVRELPRIGWMLRRPSVLLRALGLMSAMKDVRPRTHAYLHLLAVHPATQGRGVGAALLNAAPKSLCLETFERRNVEWYEKRGFRAVGEVRSPVRPIFWALRRG